MTIIALEHSEKSSQVSFDVSKETLQCTHWAKTLQIDSPRTKALHLEAALRLGDAMGGHAVSGHIEAVATLENIKHETSSMGQKFCELTFSLPRDSGPAAFLLQKGSVAIDGVSLTINRVWDKPGLTYFSVYLVPHTLEKCHFGILEVGDQVNIESDLMARHYCRYQELRGSL